MRRAPQWLLSVSAVALLAGCASSLQLHQGTRPADLSELRAEYRSGNPKSPYLANVHRGEVVKGMDRLGVLASWGYPERRVRDGDGERWVYVEEDDASGDRVTYELAFLKGVLQNWDMGRLTTGMGPVSSGDTTAPPVPVAGNEPGSKIVPQN
jgi:hypothetical protein